MQTFTASIELDAEDTAALHAAARFFKMPLPAFLNACLQQGFDQASAMAASAEMDREPPQRPDDGRSLP